MQCRRCFGSGRVLGLGSIEETCPECKGARKDRDFLAKKEKAETVKEVKEVKAPAKKKAVKKTVKKKEASA